MEKIFRIPAFPIASYELACTVDPAVMLFKNGFATETTSTAFRLLSDVNHIMSKIIIFYELFTLEELKEIKEWYTDSTLEALRVLC